MTAKAARLKSILYNTEASWAVNTSTFGTRLQVVGEPSLSLEKTKLNINPSTQYQNEGAQHVQGTYAGTLTFDMLATGATDAAGGLSDLGTLLGLVVGNNAQSSAADTEENASGSTATAIAVDAATGHSAGGICRVGSLADGAAEGMFAAISTHAASTINLLTALPSAPTDTHVVYTTELVYPNETPQTTLSGVRFRCLSANKQYALRGCFPVSLALNNTGPGGLPTWSFTWGVSYWVEENVTFPDTTATSAATGAPVSAGRFFYNDVGTATEKTDNIVDFSINFDLQTEPIVGPGGTYEGQVIIGAVRHKCMASFTTVHNTPATGTDTFADLHAGTTYQHCLYQLSNADGRALGLYFPRVAVVGTRPTQANVDGLNRTEVQWECHTGATVTSDLTSSNWRLAMA